MNIEKLLQHNFKELEAYLNHAIINLNYTDINAHNVRRIMYNTCKNLFDDSITVKNSSSTELTLSFGKIQIIFGIGTKNTGSTVEVSRLHKKDIKQPGKFKVKNMLVSFNEPCFIEELNDNYTVNVNEHEFMRPTYFIWFEKYTDTIIGDLLTREVFEKQLPIQNENFNIENSLVLLMSQPWIKKTYFDSNFTQIQWDNILEKVKNTNKELLKTCVDNFYKVF